MLQRSPDAPNNTCIGRAALPSRMLHACHTRTHQQHNNIILENSRAKHTHPQPHNYIPIQRFNRLWQRTVTTINFNRQYSLIQRYIIMFLQWHPTEHWRATNTRKRTSGQRSWRRAVCTNGCGANVAPNNSRWWNFMYTSKSRYTCRTRTSSTIIIILIFN